MKTSHFTLLLQNFSSKHFSFYHVTLTFLAILTIRFCVEIWIVRFAQHGLDFYFFGFLHTALFFYLIVVCCVWLMTQIAKLSRTQAVHLLLYGFVLVIFPPIIDHLISLLFFEGTGLLSYYLFDEPVGLLKSFFTFFGDRPRDGITYGTRLIIAITILAMGAITYANTKKILRAFFMMCAVYITFFCFSALPSFFTYVFSSTHLSTNASSVAGFIASPTSIINNPISNAHNAIIIKMTLIYVLLSILCTLLALFIIYRTAWISLVKNMRPIQCLYHIGLVSIGFGLALIFGEGILLFEPFTIIAVIILYISVIIAWYSTVIFNDIVDIDIDRISNPTRPLVTKIISVTAYNHLGIFFTMFSIILIGCVNYYAIIPLLLYHALSYIYNTPPLRLKRFPIIATFIAALASFCMVIIGYITISHTHSLHNFPLHVCYLLIISYTVSLPIKDLKDIVGDKVHHIYTIPVLLGEKTGRLMIAIGIFSSFILSVFTFNDLALLWPSLLAGTLCFWILVGTRHKKFVFDSHKSVGMVFMTVVLYGIILVLTLF